MIVVLAVFTALTALMTMPQVLRLSTSVADHEDPLLSIWRLSWIAHQLPRDPLHLFDGNIFYPERRTLAFTDAVLLPGLVAAPLHWLGVSPILIYNLLLLGGFVLSGAATYLLVHSLTGSSAAAWLAGIVFAFAPYRFAHYEHLELQLAFWMPLALWSAHRTLAHGRWRDGLLTGAFVAGQVYCSLYYGVFFGLYLSVVAGVLLVLRPAAGRRRSLAALLLGATLAAGICAPYTLPYFANREVVGVRQPFEVLTYSAQPQDYLVANHKNLVYGWTDSMLGSSERHLFPGAIAIGLALLGLIRPSRAARTRVVAYAAGLVFAIDASLGLNGWFFAWAYDHLPGFQGLRAPARFGIIVVLSLAVIGGFGAARLFAELTRERARRVVGVVGAILLLEYATALSLFTVPEPPSVYDWLRRQPPAVIAEVPMPRPDRLGLSYDSLYMYFSTAHWHHLVNGYSGFHPPSYLELLEHMRQFPDGTAIRALRRRGVDYLIVHGRFYTPDQLGAIVAALAQRADLIPVGRFPARDGETHVYRLLPPEVAGSLGAARGGDARVPLTAELSDRHRTPETRRQRRHQLAVERLAGRMPRG